MVTLRCTRKLLSRGLTEDDAAESHTNTLLGDWYANVLVVRPSHLVLCVSERTLLPVVVLAKDIKRLPNRLAETLQVVLGALHIEPLSIDAEVGAMRTYHIARTASKSVLGSLNDLVYQLEWQLQAHPDLSLVEQSLRLAQVPMKGVEHSSPDRATVALFASQSALRRAGQGNAL